MKKSAAREDKQASRNEVWNVWGQLRAGKKPRERRERKHSWPYVCSYAVQLVASQSWPPPHVPSPHHSPACLDAQRLHPPPAAAAAAAAAGAATLQNEPPPHISAQVRAHSWVLDTDLTRGPSEAWVVAWQDDGRPACRSELFCCLTGRLLTVLRSWQTDEAECAAGKRSWTLEAGLIRSIFRVTWNEFVAATWEDVSLEMQWECGDWITSLHTATAHCQLSSVFFK